MLRTIWTSAGLWTPVDGRRAVLDSDTICFVFFPFFFAMAILLAGGNLVDFGVEILLGSGERPDEKFDLTEILAEILPF